jgi:hypothetical protein
MIGGQDIVIDVRNVLRSTVLDYVVRCIQDRWPHPIVVDGATGNRFDRFANIPFSLVSELLVYRDRDAFDSWKDLGADPQNANTMIHAILGDDSVTLVVDDVAESTMASTVKAVQETLEPRNFWGRAAAA